MYETKGGTRACPSVVMNLSQVIIRFTMGDDYAVIDKNHEGSSTVRTGTITGFTFL